MHVQSHKKIQNLTELIIGKLYQMWPESRLWGSKWRGIMSNCPSQSWAVLESECIFVHEPCWTIPTYDGDKKNHPGQTTATAGNWEQCQDLCQCWHKEGSLNKRGNQASHLPDNLFSSVPSRALSVKNMMEDGMIYVFIYSWVIRARGRTWGKGCTSWPDLQFFLTLFKPPLTPPPAPPLHLNIW